METESAPNKKSPETSEQEATILYLETPEGAVKIKPKIQPLLSLGTRDNKEERRSSIMPTYGERRTAQNDRRVKKSFRPRYELLCNCELEGKVVSFDALTFSQQQRADIDAYIVESAKRLIQQNKTTNPIFSINLTQESLEPRYNFRALNTLIKDSPELTSFSKLELLETIDLFDKNVIDSVLMLHNSGYNISADDIDVRLKTQKVEELFPPELINCINEIKLTTPQEADANFFNKALHIAHTYDIHNVVLEQITQEQAELATAILKQDTQNHTRFHFQSKDVSGEPKPAH